MSLLAVFFGICAIALCAATNYHRNRAANLEIQCALHLDALDDARAKLDDATRNYAHVRHLHASLLCENNTLVAELRHMEVRNQYLESLYSHRKGHVAGYKLLDGHANAAEKMQVVKVSVAP